MMRLTKADVDLIVFDFDGVLTNNKVFVFQDGTEAVCCDRADGLAFDSFRKEKISSMIMSTEKNPVVSQRAKKLQIPVLQAIEDKAISLQNYCTEHQLDLDRVMFVGNDLNDYAAMKQVGYPVAPADAHVEITQISKIVLQAAGGNGVAREIAEKILLLNMK